MLSLIFLSILYASAVTAQPLQQRIVGGSLTTINNYPFAVAVLRIGYQANYYLACGGVILNNRSVLTAAHCFYLTSPNEWRLRVGSSYASSGGSVHNVAYLISHPDFQDNFKLNDIGIFRVSPLFQIGTNIQPGRFAGANYVVVDNQTVWTMGWGATIEGPVSNQLRHVQIRIVNQDTCRRNYNITAMPVTNLTMCAGNLEQGGQDPCNGDYGGALLHEGNVIGISSWSSGCGYRGYPAVYTRVPRYISWIQNNA